MSILGFPSETDISSMMGYVTDEDRAQWLRMKEASDRQLEEANNGLTAKGLALQSATPAIGIAEKVIGAQMHAASTEDMRKTGMKQTKRTVTTLETEEPVLDDEGMGY